MSEQLVARERQRHRGPGRKLDWGVAVAFTLAGWLLGWVVAFLFILVVGLGSMAATPSSSELGGAINPSSVAEALDTPCETEDSVNCHWFAEVQGNGEGSSYLNIEGHLYPLNTLTTEGN